MVEAVWCIDWWESERGWGQKYIATQNFATKEEAENKIKEHWSLAPERVKGFAPDYYVFPKDPYLKEK